MEDREAILVVWYDDKDTYNEELEKIKDKIRKIEGVSYVTTYYQDETR